MTTPKKEMGFGFEPPHHDWDDDVTNAFLSRNGFSLASLFAA